MGESRGSRNRAVRLSPEALELLTSELLRRAGSGESGVKLTRKARADFMGVSEGTSRRVLEGKGVDRTTLEHVFKTLDLTWQDEYKRPVGDQDEEALELDTGVPPPKSRVRWMPIAALAVVLTALPASGIWIANSRSQSEEYRMIDQVNHLLNQGIDEFRSAKYAQARKTLDGALPIARRVQKAGQLSTALRVSGDIYSAQGALDLAATEYSEAITLRKAIKEDTSLPALYLELASINSRRKRFADAKEQLKIALDGFINIKIPHGVAECQRELGTVCFREKDYAEALSWYASARSTMAHDPEAAIHVDIEGREGLVLRETGRLHEAEQKLSRCLAYWTRHNHPRWMARLNLNLGTVELLRGKALQARSRFVQSKAAFQSLGDQLGAAEAEEWLTRAEKGVTAQRAGSNTRQVKTR